MTRAEIARQRLSNQHLIKPTFTNPSAVVGYLGAVQAQDYPGAKWAVGQRTQSAVDATIEQAVRDGSILRTHVLRPTWHFVTPADIRWLLALTAPRVNTVSGHMYRKLELDESVFRRSNTTLAKALEGGKQLTRAELSDLLERAGIENKSEFRLLYLLMRAELDGLICSGPWRGKQATYALLEERAPPAKPLQRDESLAELTRRYFTTRGPATVYDFAWWSGLTVTDARRGLQIVEPVLEQQAIEGQTYWFANASQPIKKATGLAHLLPNYDEYFIGYRDRSAILEMVHAANADAQNQSLWSHVIAIDGQIMGGWKRSITRGAAVIELTLIKKLSAAEQRAVARAVQKYSEFLQLPVEIT